MTNKMSARFSNRNVWLNFLAAAYTVLLVGCIPGTNRVAAVPVDFVATGEVGAIVLSWQPSAGASGYVVKRAVASDGPYTQIASTSSTSYTDTSVTAGNTYFYVVSSMAPSGESGNSAVISAATIVTPSAPANVTATAGDSQVQLTWGASNGAANYVVKRATVSGGPYTQIAAPTSTSFLDGATSNGVAYYYVVSAVNPAGEGPVSAQVRAMPNVQNPPPATFGTWVNVTPAGVDLTSELCSNFGATTIQVDPAHPSHLYTLFHCQGIWKSTDHGATWTGPINSGTNGSFVSNCSGGLTIPPGSTKATPTIYVSCIRGASTGFWKSNDGGVNWVQHIVGPSIRQDFFQPVVDPYDDDHLLMAGHEFDSVVESVDGGQTWSSVPLVSGMLQSTRSPSIFFINTGVASSTRSTWLWIGDQAGGVNGTWRTANGGSSWVRVDSNEHVGYTQIYQPDADGVVYMAGAASASGSGVLRSTDYGQTWDHVGLFSEQSVVFGTGKNVYAMFGSAVGPGVTIDPRFRVAAQPGTGTWVPVATPAGISQGTAQVEVVSNGSSSILVGAMWNSGIWRYVEP